MKTVISQQEIGKRVAALRKKKEWSQDDLAKNLGISRSSLAQIELGNRSLDVIEFYMLSMMLGFSMDSFMAQQFTMEDDINIEEKKEAPTAVRISVPKLNVEKFKNVLLYIIKRCAGKPNVGETVLYKLLYFTDFNYYEKYEEQLTGANYRKLPYGPVPSGMEKIINQMINKGQLQKIQTDFHGYSQKRYIPLVHPDLTKLKASELKEIDNVIDLMGDWSAGMINEYSHGDKPWKATGMNEDLNYELSFYRRPPYSVRVNENME